MTGKDLDQLAKRLSIYVGLAAAIASALSTANHRFFLIFVAIAAFFLSWFLLRIAIARRPEDAQQTRADWSFRRIAAAIGLLVVLVGSGTAVWKTWPPPMRPELEIVTFRVEEHDALAANTERFDDLFERYATEHSLDVDDVRTLYGEADATERSRAIRDWIVATLESDPLDIKLTSLEIVIGNTSEDAQYLSAIDVRVHSSILLGALKTHAFDVLPYRQIAVGLCPEPRFAESPQIYPVLRDTIGLRSSAEDPELMLTIHITNDPECTRWPGLALYELDVELTFGEGKSARTLRSERKIAAVPTISYAFGRGRTGLESVEDFKLADLGMVQNLRKALAWAPLWDETDPDCFSLSSYGGRIQLVANAFRDALLEIPAENVQTDSANGSHERGGRRTGVHFDWILNAPAQTLLKSTEYSIGSMYQREAVSLTFPIRRP